MSAMLMRITARQNPGTLLCILAMHINYLKTSWSILMLSVHLPAALREQN